MYIEIADKLILSAGHANLSEQANAVKSIFLRLERLLNELRQTDDISLEVDAGKLAKDILKHASESKNEEDLKMRVEHTLRPRLEVGC